MPELEHGADKSGRLSRGVGQCLDPPFLGTGHSESLWTVGELACDRQFLLRFAYLPAGLLRLAVLAGVTLHICILMFADFNV